jgi:hypothetical protein
VHGIDIAQDCLISEDRLTTFICDSRDKRALDQTLQASTYDIIIDDGSHKPDTQLQTLKNLLSRVKFGGYYIIEDLGEEVNLFVERREEVTPFIKDHEYFFGGNYLVIKKT